MYARIRNGESKVSSERKKEAAKKVTTVINFVHLQSSQTLCIMISGETHLPHHQQQHVPDA